MKSAPRNLRRSALLWSFAMGLMVNLISGCSSTLPWEKREYTSIITPAMRISAIQESASRATDSDSMEQTRLVEELAMQIRTEGDPLVRAAIQESLGDIEVPLARDVLIAGLNDDDLNVKLICCQKLGDRGEPENVPVLRGILEGSESLDVKLAATDALGKIRSPESVKTLALAVKDRDPAMQYAGVEALRQLSEQDFGNDVTAWQQFAETGQLTEKAEESIATRVIQMSPF